MEEKVKFAVIDIGSNSVRLMLWADGKTLYKKVKTTRLGEGFDKDGLLSEAAMLRTQSAVSEFAELGRREGGKLFAFATAAVRLAKNGRQFCDLIESASDLAVDVVSGEEEARLAVLGALGDRDGGVIDLGGASTEICLMQKGEPTFSRSLDLGAVRLHDACGEDLSMLNARIESETGELPLAHGVVYAVGGTASTLASLKLGLTEYDPDALQETPLSLAWIEETAKVLFSLPIGERKALRGMDPSRADVLGGAALLLARIMEKMKLKEVRFSDRDNLEGYLALRGMQ